MQRISCKTAGLVVVLALTLVGGVQAQQHQQHHPGGAQAPQPPAETGPGAPPQPQMMDQMQGMMGNMQGMMEHMQGMMEHMQGMMGGGMMGRRGMGMMGQEEEADEEDAPQRGMMGRHGMMGRGGMMGPGGMIQHHLERLAQQLELTEEQRTQMWTLLSTHAKEAIRLRADIEILGIDFHQLLEAEPVDLPKVKQVLQIMADKEADLRFIHITAMQEIGKALTPEQRQKLRAMRRSMLGHSGTMGMGGMMGHGGMLGRSGMMGSGGMRGRGQREK